MASAIVYTMEWRRDIGHSIMAMKCTLVIPVRSFADAKSRLSNSVSEKDREEFMRLCVQRVVDAGKATDEIHRIVMISGSKDVLSFASGHDIDCLDTDSALNDALREYRMFNMDENLLIALGDLPWVKSFDTVCAALQAHSVVLAPDRHRAGTNILAHQFNVDVPYRFGHDSFHRHCLAIEKKRFSYAVVSRPQYGFDIDTNDDYQLYEKVLKM